MAKKSKNRKIKSRRPGSDKPCKFCKKGVNKIDWKDDVLLKRFITDRGKIAPRRVTGTCARHQRMLARAIKRARFMALLPFVRVYYR
ncbi:MAG: 30S ribosomal protein S18 [Candidatus Krumholzibacteriota bacterium]|nr:30S ribosomal protein S18 [Candidatus Krumholzibacteriota bacterium]